MYTWVREKLLWKNRIFLYSMDSFLRSSRKGGFYLGRDVFILKNGFLSYYESIKLIFKKMKMKVGSILNPYRIKKISI
ncbi:hypothetical protein A0128_17620 [Leptospira tipperaryensis]|uniref:Uncharacterized protein n=1 Tax=Leptospira tipperaryensis TaxID=2564040 RepID=A0A1D7V0Z5_9LEPT|nr:hypothetical protein A0128_17620 [Leptospira tipperaryensis]